MGYDHSPSQMPLPANAIRDALDRVDELARRLTVALTRLEQVQQRLTDVERMNDIDMMLPVLNQRAFMRELQRTFMLSRRHNFANALVLVQVLGADEVAERYGRRARFALLSHVAEGLGGLLRRSDIVGRIEEDQFAGVLMQTDEPSGAGKVSEIRTFFDQIPARYLELTLPARIRLAYVDFASYASAEEMLDDAARQMLSEDAAAAP